MNGSLALRQAQGERNRYTAQAYANTNKMLVEIETYYDGELWCARGIDEDIFTQGSTLDELCQNIQEAVSVHFGDTSEPIIILSISR